MPPAFDPPKPVFRPVAPTVKKLTLWQLIGLEFQIKDIINLALDKNMKINGSWKTTVFGAGGLLIIVTNVASMLLDGNPNTNPDWSVTIPSIMACLVGLFARDNNKTSEDVGAK